MISPHFCYSGMFPGLPLHSAGSISAGKFLDFVNAYAVKIALNGMLKSGSGNRKLNGILGGIIVYKGIDQACPKGITASHSVDDVEVILF